MAQHKHSACHEYSLSLNTVPTTISLISLVCSTVGGSAVFRTTESQLFLWTQSQGRHVLTGWATSTFSGSFENWRCKSKKKGLAEADAVWVTYLSPVLAGEYQGVVPPGFQSLALPLNLWFSPPLKIGKTTS